MTDQFVAEIRIFPFNFPPRQWAFCDGQLLPLSQNTALFSLLGTMYGGNGVSNFALPNLQGMAPMNFGDGPGLTSRVEGETSGSDFVTLLQTEMPLHNHPLLANANPSNLAAPNPNRSLARAAPGSAYNAATTGLTNMSPLAVSVAGASLPHNNLMPYLTLNFCIALQGIFPARG